MSPLCSDPTRPSPYLRYTGASWTATAETGSEYCTTTTQLSLENNGTNTVTVKHAGATKNHSAATPRQVKCPWCLAIYDETLLIELYGYNGPGVMRCDSCRHHLNIVEEEFPTNFDGIVVMFPHKTLKKLDYDVLVEEAARVLNKIAQHKKELEQLAEEMGLQNG
jgi:hypothetical protein